MMKITLDTPTKANLTHTINRSSALRRPAILLRHWQTFLEEMKNKPNDNNTNYIQRQEFFIQHPCFLVAIAFSSHKDTFATIKAGVENTTKTSYLTLLNHMPCVDN